jgi:hypothetical protein
MIINLGIQVEQKRQTIAEGKRLKMWKCEEKLSAWSVGT